MRRAITLIFVVCTCAAWAQTTRNFTVIMRTVGNHTFWDGNGVNIFGFSSAMSQPATLPARTLYCNEGDTVIITATNISQGEHHTIHLHGLDVDTRNDGDPATSFWLEHMQDTTYTFVATNPGTYLYHCHVADVVHVQMGMYGLIVVKAAGGTNNAWTGGPMYHKDYKWLMSEVDVYWHENVPQHNQAMDTVNLPPYQPDYFLINGSSQSQLAADDSTRITGAQGEYIYMRLANIGFFNNRVMPPSSIRTGGLFPPPSRMTLSRSCRANVTV
jgi:FtsP/CotA-like multicopper oxidase with cupredoxin domain